MSARSGPGDQLEEVQRALAQRPALSARASIAGGFFLTFLVVFAITVVEMITLSDLRSRIRFLEDAGQFEVELLGARKAEKNYLFFRGSDPEQGRKHLQEALEHLQRARSIADQCSTREEAAPDGFDCRTALEHLDEYEALLEELATSPGSKAGPGAEKIREIRQAGRRIASEAALFLSRGRQAVDRTLDRALLLAVVFLVGSFLLMGVLAVALTLRVVRPINRFVAYTRRIAAGDFSPITPARRYRDEFSELAAAINVMLRELDERQAQVARAGKLAALGTLTSGIAHELNNPLNNISLTTETLLENLENYEPREARRLLEDIFNQVDRASATVRNLLDFTRKEKPVFLETYLPEVVLKASHLVRNEAKLAGVKVRIEMPEELPPIRACARDLTQVFLNLFLNAIQAMPGGGTLTVTGDRPDRDHVRVEVRDTGTGIEPEALEKIFEPFFTTKEVGVGTGLGLTVTHRLVENHGGRIEVESRPGEGTAFSVILPVKGPPEEGRAV